MKFVKIAIVLFFVLFVPVNVLAQDYSETNDCCLLVISCVEEGLTTVLDYICLPDTTIFGVDEEFTSEFSCEFFKGVLEEKKSMGENFTFGNCVILSIETVKCNEDACKMYDGCCYTNSGHFSSTEEQCKKIYEGFNAEYGGYDWEWVAKPCNYDCEYKAWCDGSKMMRLSRETGCEPEEVADCKFYSTGKNGVVHDNPRCIIDYLGIPTCVCDNACWCDTVDTINFLKTDCVIESVYCYPDRCQDCECVPGPSSKESIIGDSNAPLGIGWAAGPFGAGYNVIVISLLIVIVVALLSGGILYKKTKRKGKSF
ncbi:MAG: hypothetical protein ABIF08_02640 [Nanoarchaeota archaeon]